MARENKNGTLILLVERGNEINVEFSKKEIVNKINSYFGYKLINQIRLQTFSFINKKKIKKNVINKTSQKFKKQISKIKSKNIRDSLSELLEVAKK